MKDINLIGISGKIGSGKDTVGKIIQYLDYNPNISFSEFEVETLGYNHKWVIKKYAGKLKEIVSLLTGIKVSDLEKEEIKNMVLPKSWNRYYLSYYKLITNNNPKGKISKYFNSYKEINDYVVSLKENNEGGYIIASQAQIIEESITVRCLLQEIGTEAMRNVIHPNIWINSLFSDFDKNKKWIITDVRFVNEAKRIKEEGGILIRVNSDYQKLSDGSLIQRDGMLDPKHNHPSETTLDDYIFDYVISNNTTIENLISEVKKIFL